MRISIEVELLPIIGARSPRLPVSSLPTVSATVSCGRYYSFTCVRELVTIKLNQREFLRFKIKFVKVGVERTKNYLSVQLLERRLLK